MSLAGQIGKRPIITALGVGIASTILTSNSNINSNKFFKEQLNNISNGIQNSKQNGILQSWEKLLGQGAASFLGEGGRQFFEKYGTEFTLIGAGALALTSQNFKGYGVALIFSGLVTSAMAKHARMQFNRAAQAQKAIALQQTAAVENTSQDAVSATPVKTDASKNAATIEEKKLSSRANTSQEDSAQEDLTQDTVTEEPDAPETDSSASESAPAPSQGGRYGRALDLILEGLGLKISDDGSVSVPADAAIREIVIAERATDILNASTQITHASLQGEDVSGLRSDSVLLTGLDLDHPDFASQTPDLDDPGLDLEDQELHNA